MLYQISVITLDDLYGPGDISLLPSDYMTDRIRSAKVIEEITG